ncbi:MAG: cold-shock protein [Bosea sp. (in: a-proteobacteria)]|nr:cold-shock protein [Bosea sp. (in: a-proteobacteria)]
MSDEFGESGRPPMGPIQSLNRVVRLDGPGHNASDVAVEINGYVKWFDVSKGYGFVVPETGGPDVLLHVTILKRDGFNTIAEGARIVLEAVEKARGRQAVRVLSIDTTAARHPSEMPLARTNVTVAPTSGLERMEVKWFNRLRGFGFVSKGEGAPDVFVHMETLRRYGLVELVPGQTVLVRYGPGPKGLMAAEIRLEAGGVAASH